MGTHRFGSKIALVTGASRGIGRGTALRLAREGAFTVVHYAHDEAAAADTLGAIERDGGEGALVRADFAQPGALDTMFDALDAVLRERRARLDILVANAGMGCICPMADMTEKTFDALFALNVRASFFLTQRALSRLADGGRIIQLSSVVTRMAMPAVGAYAMTKGAIDTMTLWLAKELGPRGITVNAVAPGVIDTAMNADVLRDDASRAYIASLSALGRVGRPDDVADVIAFLASDDARWITGRTIDVSGGTFLG